MIQERDKSIISQLRERIRKLEDMLLKSESQNYCKICGNTLDGYIPPWEFYMKMRSIATMKGNPMIQEPVHQDNNDLWYFWEETWAFRQGPFETEKEAQDALEKYCREQLDEPDVTKTHSFEEHSDNEERSDNEELEDLE